MNEFERRLRFLDTYVAAAFAALKFRALPDGDEIDTYVELFTEEGELLWIAYHGAGKDADAC